MKTILLVLSGVLCGLLLSGGLLFFVLPQKGEPIKLSTLTPSTSLCQVDGGVKSPGVYSFLPGERITDAIEKAGGLQENADISSINLVSYLFDGQKITIPTQSSHQIPESTPVESLININIATLEELMVLPGIGETIANEIIHYRDAQGSFQNIRDILNVPGIGQSIFDKISSRITVN